MTATIWQILSVKLMQGKFRTFWDTHKIRKNLPHAFDKSADCKRQYREEDFFKLWVLVKKSEHQQATIWCGISGKIIERYLIFNLCVPSHESLNWEAIKKHNFSNATSKRLWAHCENWKERKLCAGRKKSHHLLKLGGVEFSSNQRLSQVLPALLQNEIEEDELGILKCEQNNGAKFVLKSHCLYLILNGKSPRLLPFRIR